MYRKQKSLSHISGPHSYWIIGEQQASEWGALQKDTFTARLLLYVYVGYPTPYPQNPPDLHQSQEWSLAKVVDMSTPWRRPCRSVWKSSVAQCAAARGWTKV